MNYDQTKRFVYREMERLWKDDYLMLLNLRDQQENALYGYEVHALGLDEAVETVEMLQRWARFGQAEQRFA